MFDGSDVPEIGRAIGSSIVLDGSNKTPLSFCVNQIPFFVTVGFEFESSLIEGWSNKSTTMGQ